MKSNLSFFYDFYYLHPKKSFYSFQVKKILFYIFFKKLIVFLFVCLKLIGLTLCLVQWSIQINFCVYCEFSCFHMDSQFFKHHLLKDFPSSLNAFGMFVENQLAAWVWFVSGVSFCSIDLFILMSIILHRLDYSRFMMCLEIKLWQPPSLFFFSLLFCHSSLWHFHRNVEICLSVS